MRRSFLIVLLLAVPTLAAPPKKKGGAPALEDGMYNVAQTSLGASATGSGAPFNKDWPADNAISPEDKSKNGTMFGSPMVGGRVDIHLAVPVDIKGIETTGLDYHGTKQVKAIDIYIDDKLAKHADLPETPGELVRIPLDGKGQVVSIVATEEYGPRTDLGPKDKPLNYGGWKRIRVLSSTDLSTLMKSPTNYLIAGPVGDSIAETTDAASHVKVEVSGDPREAKGWPRTMWDKEDVERFKQVIETNDEAKKQFSALKRGMDSRMTKPVGVPEPEKDDKGEWKHLTSEKITATHNTLSLDIANLGTVYQLSGDEKYGEFCKKILLAYADAFPNYGVGARPGFTHDPSKVFDQRLSDATWLIQVARGYDLIHDLPSITPEERKHIEDDLLKADAIFIAKNSSTMKAPTNWSAICVLSVLTVGYATDDQALIDLAMYGPGGTKDKPTGGVTLDFSATCIDEDGLWPEGSTGYQFMAMEALTGEAEILWRHNVDMYRARDGAFKRLFDSPIRYAYPDLNTPAMHDGGGGSIISYESNLWEYGYMRYKDPAYLTILNKASMNLGAQFQKFPVSVFNDKDTATPPPMEWKNVNFKSVGFGINRLTTDAGTVNLLLNYGPNRSHGHPDKLNIDLYAFDGRLIPAPGSVWYEQPIYKNWYATTMANNTLVINEKSQLPADATELVYAPAETFALQRAITDQPYPGVTMDRSLFFTPEYLGDVFGAFSQIEHKVDLAWHFLGKVEPSIEMADYKFPEPQERGYSALTEVKHGSTDKSWSATIQAKNGTARFVSAGGTPTEVIIGNGYYKAEHPPTILERRDNAKSTVFANVVDISGQKEPYVKGVTSDGGLEKGYVLMTIDTAKGSDLCFSSLHAGKFEAGPLQTDAQQATVLRDGEQVRSMYLAGGTSLKVGDVSITRNEPGLAYMEKVATGAYVVGNPSKTDATVTLTFAPLAKMSTYQLQPNGQRSGPANVTKQDKGAIAVSLAGGTRVEFAPDGVASAYDFKQATLRKRELDRAAAEKAVADATAARSAARVKDAAANVAPADTVVVVQAEDMANQGGGEAKVVTNKVAAVGTALIKWDGNGHWIEWKVNVPADGYYNLSACYCTQQATATREISINGEVQDADLPLKVDSTGGFSGNSDDWRLGTAKDTIAGAPLLLKFKKGENTVRLMNIDGNSMNLDYIMVTSPDVKPSRTMVKAPTP